MTPVLRGTEETGTSSGRRLESDKDRLWNGKVQFTTIYQCQLF